MLCCNREDQTSCLTPFHPVHIFRIDEIPWPTLSLPVRMAGMLEEETRRSPADMTKKVNNPQKVDSAL